MKEEALLQGRKKSALALALCLILAGSLAGAETQETPVASGGARPFVDFSTLQSLNPDCVGWLYQAGGGVNQPVMRGEKDAYYASHSFENTSMRGGGTVYLRADAEMDDSLLRLYGNSGKKNAPFCWLKDYADQAYYEAHPSFLLLTPAGDWQLDVFACIPSQQVEDAVLDPSQARDGFQRWLEELNERSVLTPRQEALPQEGQRLAVLSNALGGKRTVVCAAMRPLSGGNGQGVNLVKQELDSRETVSGVQDVGPLGRMMVYAQNDPLWERMRYESGASSKYRNLGGGGCGPLAVAIAIVNLVPRQQLPALRPYAANGVGTLFCSCSVNRYYCNRQHAPYLLETPDEYLRYLPVAIADFAAGNNQWKVKGRYGGTRGTNMTFLKYLCEIYGLRMEVVKRMDPALDMLANQTGRGLVICCALNGPFTSSSHYVVIAGMDETYVYILDPLRREQKEYTQDRRGVVEVLTPGVVRVEKKNLGRCELVPTAYIENPSLYGWTAEENEA